MPVFTMVFLIAALSSMGMPPLNGFIGEFTILQGAYQMSFNWAFWCAVGIALGAAYLLWLYQRVFWGKVTNEENRHLLDLNGRELATLAPLVLLCFWIGIYPKPVLDFLHGPAARVAAIVQPDKFGPGAAAPAVAEAEPLSAPAPASH